MTTSLTTTPTSAQPAIAEYLARSVVTFSAHLCDDDCAYCCGPETD